MSLLQDLLGGDVGGGDGGDVRKGDPQEPNLLVEVAREGTGRRKEMSYV